MKRIKILFVGAVALVASFVGITTVETVAPSASTPFGNISIEAPQADAALINCAKTNVSWGVQVKCVNHNLSSPTMNQMRAVIVCGNWTYPTGTDYYAYYGVWVPEDVYSVVYCPTIQGIIWDVIQNRTYQLR